MSDQVVSVVAVDPESVACPASLLACGLRTLGVKEHPRFPFRDATETVDGKQRRTWTWHFEAKGTDGQETKELMGRWQDAAWLAANPSSDVAVVKRVLENFGVHARNLKAAIPRAVLRQGNRSVHIPATASVARKDFLIGKFEGRIPMNQKFQEPVEAK